VRKLTIVSTQIMRILLGNNQNSNPQRVNYRGMLLTTVHEVLLNLAYLLYFAATISGTQSAFSERQIHFIRRSVEICFLSVFPLVAFFHGC